MQTFDESCPHCLQQIDYRSKWESRDYAVEFRFECDKCSGRIDVLVHTIPEFAASKAKCAMCNMLLSGDDGHYCGPCQSRLQQLSEYNKRHSGESVNA